MNIKHILIILIPMAMAHRIVIEWNGAMPTLINTNPFVLRGIPSLLLPLDRL